MDPDDKDEFNFSQKNFLGKVTILLMTTPEYK